MIQNKHLHLMAICSGSNIWDNRMSFCSVLYWNQLWLSFGVNVEIKVFPRKVNSRVRSVSYSKMNTLLFLCIFTFRVDWNVCFFVENEKYLCLSERRQTICGSFKINTTSWVLHSQCKNACVLFILTMICFCFFLIEGMTGDGWCCRSGTLSTLFGNAP